MIRIGCSGFQKSHGEYYRTFPAIEIQETFYNLPRPETAVKWRKEAPRDFEFTLKAWQLITHEAPSPTYRRLRQPLPRGREGRYGSFKPTEEVLEAWEKTREFALALKATVLLFQCPASFKPTEENKKALKKFFKRIGDPPFRLALEVRGEWKPEDLPLLVHPFDLLHAVDPFSQESAREGMIYYRLHGKGGYAYRYTPQDLKALAKRIGRVSSGYVFFNNVSMWDDAKQFLQMKGERI